MLLNLHSYYSLRYGTISMDELIKMLISKGHNTAVLTDINNSSGVFTFIKKCQDAGINGLAGMEFRNGDKLLYIGIARNQAGFAELNQHRTRANYAKESLPEVAPEFNDVFVVYPFRSRKVSALRENEYIGIKPGQLMMIAREPRANFEKYVMLWPVTIKNGTDYSLHQQLRAVDHNILYAQLTIDMLAHPAEKMPSMQLLLDTYQYFPEITRATEQLLSQCRFDFDFTVVRNKKHFTGNAYDDKLLLAELTQAGRIRRYGAENREAQARVEKELRIIDDLKFSAYFLITYDIIRYASSRSFRHVGRGSGANSIVAYCLGITEVCPIELDLYFERFLNPKRATPPDFDIDFSWKDRDEIFTYIFRRYQTRHTALMGAMSTFQDRSIIRELGKVYGLPKIEIDLLVHEPGSPYIHRQAAEIIMKHFELMENFPNQRTIHACGILISEEPITHYTALDYPPKNMPTTQFDMHVAELIKFEKFDILSQRGLGHIKDCERIILGNTGQKIDISTPARFFADPGIKAQLRSTNTIGCFYIESPAMRQLIRKLGCDNYQTLVAASSVIRPGVASSGMMEQFIRRHRKPESTVYLHEVMEQQLKETYGVMVYQEDVIKVGHFFGGLDLADADVLRRTMSGKYRGSAHLIEIKDKFFQNCQELGRPLDIAQEVWRQMESFASYSFSKAHSASFAVESWQSLYLKTYYPVEFMVSVLNNEGGFYSRAVYIQEARNAGAKVHLPCVNKSQMGATLNGKDIYLGFNMIKSLEQNTVEVLLKERERSGEYKSLENLMLRTGISVIQVGMLISAGALNFTGSVKTAMQWEAHYLSTQKSQVREAGLFDAPVKMPVLPSFEYSPLQHLYDETELFGYPVSGSFFDLIDGGFEQEVFTCTMQEHHGKGVTMLGELVTYKTIPTKTGKVMKFGCFMDRNRALFDTVHFPGSLQAWDFTGMGIYRVEGKVTCEHGHYSIIVEKFTKMPLMPNPKNADQ
jgi:DNA-directed DNA polymerase III PolC